ncbi:hypothetical protein IE53DRAFT_333240 [Violaceomyces palustris]|uniref:Uncharacterized protein n=1 Tax=Violaceomyces palustris TaxID=1673888 RepID=A0ACD0NSA2_9BASI|nr:hypothetical protein IE53DRAFT_333240 [Violaceomyces palustris]
MDRTMDEQRCKVEFPAFYDQIENNVRAWQAKGGITLKDVDDAQFGAADGWGFARIIIKDGQLYIREVREGNESRMSALLHLLYQAVTTDPSSARGGGEGSLPAIDMVISTADKDGIAAPAGWVMDKRVDEDPRNGRWLVPDFGFAGWPEAGIASYEEFLLLADKEERDHSWEKKDSRAFWRGFANFYATRKDLLQRTSLTINPSRSTWSDVRETSFHDVGEQFSEIVPMHEHCRRKYLIHSEGNSYSGRSKYLLACHSVTIAHPLEWTQHFHPALNSDPTSPEQNIVQLPGPLFNGLEEEVLRLREMDKSGLGTSQGKVTPLSQNSARRIADNARQVLRQRYLTPAATMCYTRAALKAYASVQEVKTWPESKIDGLRGPSPKDGPGGGVVPSGGKGKDMLKLGAKGDIEYGIWRLTGSIDWPPGPRMRRG